MPNELKTRKIFETEFARYAAFMIVFIPAMTFLYTIKTDIALIKQNHLTHIEAISKQLEEQKQEIIELKKSEIETQKQILVILEKLSVEK